MLVGRRFGRAYESSIRKVENSDGCLSQAIIAIAVPQINLLQVLTNFERTEKDVAVQLFSLVSQSRSSIVRTASTAMRCHTNSRFRVPYKMQISTTTKVL